MFGTNRNNRSTGGFKSQYTTVSNKFEHTNVSRTGALKTTRQMVDVTPNNVFVHDHNTSGTGIIVGLSEERLKSDLIKDMMPLVDEIIQEDEIFNDVNRELLYESLPKMLDRLPVEKVPLNKDEMKRRLKKIMALEVMSNLFNDLTPEQLEAFDETVHRGRA